MERYFIGDTCLCWSLGDEIDQSISLQILEVFKILKAQDSLFEMGVLDLVPSYNALAVYFDPINSRLNRIIRTVNKTFKVILMEVLTNSDSRLPKGEAITLPVKYDGEDLERVARLNNLTENEVIRLHQEPKYMVAMVGFLPHFPYLIGLDPRLETPRLDNPRTQVPAGAVGIGGAQTGVYPSVSPGGWNLIGSTDPELLLPIKPGDTVIFKGV